MSAGQQAYEEDVRRQPTYHDGGARRRWHELPDYVRDNWERHPTPREWHRRQGVRRNYTFETTCVECPGEDAGEAINAMVADATQITRGTFLRYVDARHLWEIAEFPLGYVRHGSQGLTMAKDWHVSYHRGTFRGRPCVYFVHSAIEWIFTKRQ